MKPLLVALALLAPGASPEAWWNKDWKFRRPITVNNRLDRPLEKGFTMTVEVDPDYLGVREKSKAGLEDWALVRGDVRIPFLLQPGSGKTLLLGFRLREDIRAGVSDTYQLYYGNPEGAPLPATPEDAFEFFEDFSRPEALAERFDVDKDLTASVQDGRLVIRESANGRDAAAPCRIGFRRFPAIAGFEISFDLEMDSTEVAGAACLLSIDLKEPWSTDPMIGKKIEALIELLSDDAWDTREKATRDLIAIGRMAVAKLTEAARSADAEVKWRAGHILRQIAEKSPPPLLAAGIVGGARGFDVALSSIIGMNQFYNRCRTGWPAKTRVTLQRDPDGDVKVQWDGRSLQSGKLAGEIRQVGFTIYKKSAAPLGTIRIDNVRVSRSVGDDERPTSMIDLEQSRP
jgi:hypothetical protein